MDRTRDGQSDKVIPIYSPPIWGWGVYKNGQKRKQEATGGGEETYREGGNERERERERASERERKRDEESETRKKARKRTDNTDPLIFRVFDRIFLKHFICVRLQVVH